jgi:hypothetical protein
MNFAYTSCAPKRRSISTGTWFIPVISTAFRYSGLRPTASGPLWRMSSHGSSFWSPMRRVIPVALIPPSASISYLTRLEPQLALAFQSTTPGAFPYMWTKGIRDIFAALVMLPFIFSGDRRSIANNLRHFNYCPVWRWAGHSATPWFCATHLYALGNSAFT